MEPHGLAYCFDNLYKILSFWGVISFGLKSTQQKGSSTTAKRLILSWCIRCLFISGFLSGVLIKRLDTEMSYAMFNHISPVVKAIFSWEYLSCIITYVEFCLSMDLRHHRHIEFLHKLQQLDLPISQEFPQVKWHYQKTQLKYWYGTILVGICYLTLSILLIFDLTKCSCGLFSTLLIATCYSLITSSLGLLGIVHIAIMDYLRLRLRLTQKLLKQTYQAHTNHATTYLHSKIFILIKFNRRLSDLVIKFNAVFSFVAAAGIFYDFTLMICFVYVVCQKIVAKQFWDAEYAFMILLLSLHSYKVIIACSYGYLLKREQLQINGPIIVNQEVEIIQPLDPLTHQAVNL
ncbi:putative gustatory receptor 47b isoform X1 [Drosophila tropicalis]|uniref:putative gustatory receptor 47b isoform X1 n=1 Tax=Drosophila tropicalis TaxID=46794 RepID=UPI0035AC092A